MRQGDPRERLADVAELGLRGAQELAPHGRVEEQVADLDRRADRAAAGRDVRRARRRRTSISRPAGAVGRAAAERQPAHLGDRGQGLAAEAQRADAEQVVGVARACSWRGWPRPAAARRRRCRSRCRPRGSAPSRPRPTDTSIRVAPASTAFSINSLTTLAGRSITSPAAILLISLERWRMADMEGLDWAKCIRQTAVRLCRYSRSTARISLIFRYSVRSPMPASWRLPRGCRRSGGASR